MNEIGSLRVNKKKSWKSKFVRIHSFQECELIFIIEQKS